MPNQDDQAAHKAKAVMNERLKLSGSALNTLSVATIVSGCVLPLVSLLYGTVEPKSRFWIAFEVMWLVFGLGIQALARLIMGRYEV